ncbi:helix-turn-helix domain-containing protein [Angustibacter sp. McL0619]|uniref:arsenate reductase/protein-tyrosine-phosphatase family protein n=1 Tax=Angustibacter sp. McL0619 TaxID=3415676 RepID=UPI003CF0C755
MTTEADQGVELRARVHAALSDPSRLRVVDALELGDASPKELQQLLGLPSNLLAHHLQVLEREGLVTRHRSEADRRRSYLRLVRSGLDKLTADRVLTVTRVVFVCTANSARSQLAAALWRQQNSLPVASAGTHPAAAVADGAVAVARRHRVALRPAKPLHLDDVLAPGDYIVTVCDHAHEELHAGPRDQPSPSLHWSVPDPVPVGTDVAFDAALDDLTARIHDLSPHLVAS